MRLTTVSLGLIVLSIAARNALALPEPPEIIWTSQANTSWASALAFSPNGAYLVSGGRDNSVHIWRTSDGARVRTMQGHEREVLQVAVSPDGKAIMSASWEDRSVRLWSFDDGEFIRRYPTTAGWPAGITFSPDGALFGLPMDRTDIYNMSDGKILRTVDGRISDDGEWSVVSKYVGTGGPFNPSAYELSLWKNKQSYWAGTNDAVLRFTVPGAVGTLSPDKTMLLATTLGYQNNPAGSTLVVYSVTDGRALRNITFPSRGSADDPLTWIDGRAFSPDNQIVGAISASTRISDPGPYSYIAFWDVATGELLKYYRDDIGIPAYGDTPFVFSPDGQFFAYTRGEGTIVLARSPTTRRALRVKRGGNQAIISWVAPVSPYVLEWSATVDHTALWRTVESLPAQIGDELLVMVDFQTSPKFFRLRAK